MWPTLAWMALLYDDDQNDTLQLRGTEIIPENTEFMHIKF